LLTINDRPKSFNNNRMVIDNENARFGPDQSEFSLPRVVAGRNCAETLRGRIPVTRRNESSSPLAELHGENDPYCILGCD
jgi:hypothetical protein